MRGKGIVMLAALLCGMITGCRRTARVEVVRVVYRSDAGPVLPELAWHEEVTITPGKVTFSRSGSVAESEINAGSWEVAVDAAEVSELFARLAAVDCATLERIEPDDPPDGGHTESFTLTYAGGGTCELRFDPGATYRNGALIVEPVRAFMERLELPAEAVSRYL